MKMIAVFMAVALIVCFAAGCGQKSDPAAEKTSDGGLKIVTTIFPEYDWVMNVLGDKADGADVTMLLDNKVDLHSYQPTADDLMKISECDIFIYVGGESDEWVEDALKGAANKDMKVIDLMGLIGDKAKEEEIVEGMEEEEEEHGEGEEDEEEGPEYDEHVWLSLRNAEIIVSAIGDTLAEEDPDNADAYKANAAAYTEKLNELDGRYEEAVKAGKKDTVLFGDRFPFRYMFDDYGLKYYAAFVGCSAETEASFETVTFLANKVDELGLDFVMTIDGSDQAIARTIIENTKTGSQKILILDSMQTAAIDDFNKGKTYLDSMESNLTVLAEALA